MVRQILFRVLYSNENADKDPMYSEVISRMTFSPALLRNYLRHRVRHVSYPAVAPAKGKNVQGIFVTGLTDGDIWRLDRFEGDQYVRKMLDVEMLGDEGRFAGGEVKRAEVYVWKSKGKLGLEEKEWSIEEFRRDSLSRWVGEEGNNEYEDLGKSRIGGGRVIRVIGC
jgi:hypothetical protein